MAKEYTAATIKVRENLEFIRAEPSGLVGSKDVDGLIHLIREIIDNSVDEVNEHPLGGVIRILLLRDPSYSNIQFIVQDFGRGIPSASLVDTMTRTGTSGKTEVGAFQASGGQFGWGAKETAALSKQFRVLSSNYRESKLASVTVADGKIVDQHSEKDTSKRYGVITVFEIDIARFFDQVDLKQFIVSDWMELISLCKALNIFNDKALFEIYTLDRTLDPAFWSMPNIQARTVVEDYFNSPSKTVYYQACKVADKSEYLFELWKRSSPIVFSDTILKMPASSKDRLGFQIKWFFTKKSATGNPQYFITINNVRLQDTTGNSATIAFMTALRKQLATYLPEQQYQDFVMNIYRFPTLYVAIGISYDRAKLAGMTKHSFKDVKFYNQFLTELGGIFTSHPTTWNNLVEILRPDIEYRYAQYYDTPVAKAEDKKVVFKLNYPAAYYACHSFDSRKTELFIVEGTSAGNIIDNRDNDYQAVYTTLGKPYNGATRYDNIADNRAKLLKDPIYQDLLQILNVTDKTKDMAACKFSKLIITTDADPDGYHICSLHINNLYIINPLIITSGLVWIANPPLYSMDTKNRSRGSKLFLRNKIALMDARIKFLYEPSLEIRTVSTGKDGTVLDLSPEAYRDMCYLVTKMGDIMNTVAELLGIPLLILERLALGVEYLVKTPIDMVGIVSCFKSCDKYVSVKTYAADEVLLVSMGNKDYPIGLKSIGKLLREHVLPAMSKVRYYNYNFLVRSKHPGSDLSNWTRMSMMQVYTLFTQLNSLFPVHRYKGLGELETADCASTLLNHSTRALTHVQSVGDVERNYALLGTDATERKNLLLDTGVLDRRFTCYC